MKIFVYEYITGGGMWSRGEMPSGSLLREGQAMLNAALSDLASIRGLEVVTTRDARLKLPADFPTSAKMFLVPSATEESYLIRQLARECYGTLLIAPEFDGILCERAATVEHLGGKLISPGINFIAIAQSKSATAERLRKAGIAVPAGAIARRTLRDAALCWPAVWKPDDGAGSLGVRKLQSREAFLAAKLPDNGYLETFCPGQPASCAVLCGPGQCLPLPACRQKLGGESGFEYLGGSLPLAAELNKRAQRLAVQAVACLPSPRGYIGVDLVLGAAADGSEDVVIEINPRLTTSYVGLRRACRHNLAAAMLAIALGNEAALSFRAEALEFTADGTILGPGN